MRTNISRRYNPDRPYVIFHEVSVAKNSWRSFHVQMQARPAGGSARGVILVWKDQADTALTTASADNYGRQDVSSWKFPWGYDPARYPGTNDAFDVRVGLSRPTSTQSTTFSDGSHQAHLAQGEPARPVSRQSTPAPPRCRQGGTSGDVHPHNAGSPGVLGGSGVSPPG